MDSAVEGVSLLAALGFGYLPVLCVPGQAVMYAGCVVPPASQGGAQVLCVVVVVGKCICYFDCFFFEFDDG